MSDQCGLCLSCGVPFLPDVSKIELFNRAGVLSVMFLNNEYSRTAEITQLYESPKFASEKHLAHLFHDSHHGVAIKYMCDLHDDDEDVGVGFVPAHNALIPAGQLNAPFLYFKTPTSKNFKGPQAAMWARPRQDQRLNLRPLCIYLRAAANLQQTIPVGHNLGATVSTCMGCNMIMTQQADIRYLLGYKTVGQRNTNTPVIEERPIHQYTANAHQATLDQAYGVWTIVNPPAVPVARPAMDDADSDSPHVAYYLHKCLPFKAAARDWFASAITRPAMRASVRRLYVEQSWLLLEIAAVATLVERGKVTEPGGRLSHGLHQHFGVLDLYVSFFLFRLIEFKHGRALRRTGVDFVQWHQKYYCEALNCRGLFTDHQNRGVMAQRMYSTTDQNTKELIEQLCGRMLAHLNGRLEPLVLHITGGVNVPRPIERFFVPTGMLRTLRNKSRAVRAFFLFRLLYSLLIFFAQKTVAGDGLPVGAGQVRDQRAPPADHPAVQGIPLVVPAAAPRLPGQLAVAGDRPGPGGQRGPGLRGRVPALLHVHAHGRARRPARVQGGVGRPVRAGRVLLPLERRARAR